jgi:ABC-type multidrug transport system permease subunit
MDAQIARGQDATVQMLVDASDGNTAQIISGDAAQIVRAYNAENAGATRPEPVTAAIRLWYNPSRSSQKFYGPGIYVLAMSLFPPLLATLAMSKEGEQKTILQVYVSNISAHEFLLGKIAAFMIVATAEAIVMMMILFMGFGLRFAGDPTPFLVATILYMFTVTAFGNMIGAAIPSQVAAMQAVAPPDSCLCTCCPACSSPFKISPPAFAGFPISSGAATTSKSCATRSWRAEAGRRCGSRCWPSPPSAPFFTPWRGATCGACS